MLNENAMDNYKVEHNEELKNPEVVVEEDNESIEFVHELESD